MNTDRTPSYIKLDERNHVEKPLLDQLDGLDWEIIDLDNKQHPANSYRDSFTEVVMPAVLREQLKVINAWLEDDQVEEVVRQLTANFPGTGLIENNRHVLNLLLENTSVSENRKTGEKSPTVRFIDFKHRDNNRFTAVCQFKVRILGTEHHILPDTVLFLNGLPVVVIECKSPKVKEPMTEAIDQVLRYSEQRGAKGEGSAPLFYYNQFVVATVNNNVNFNWRLIKAPMFAIDYAIVHELTHLIESNHTPRFWNIIRAQAPTMEKAKAWLKENGQLLEQAL